MAAIDRSAYAEGTRFTRQNRELKIALSLKSAYGHDVPPKQNSKLPSLRRCAPGTFNPTFD